MHMFSCIEMHMLIYVNTDRSAYLCACLPPSMYTCICSRALWYIYSYIQTCICSLRVELYTHWCTHIWTLMLAYIHVHMYTHVHAYAHMSKYTDMTSCKETDVFLNTMNSETAVWGSLAGVIPQTAFAVRGSNVGEKRDLGQPWWSPVHSETSGCLRA